MKSRFKQEEEEVIASTQGQATSNSNYETEVKNVTDQ